MALDPFAPETLNFLLEADADRPTLLKRRESKTLELKVGFGMSEESKVDYARTMAAFANREGGYILFGIRNSPHEMDGLQTDAFERFDPKSLSEFLRNHFSPVMGWEHYLHSHLGRKFGVIYVWPAKYKPIICQRSNEVGRKLRSGEIYFRDGSETRLSTAVEIHSIIGERIELERRSWQDLLRRTAQVNPPSVAYLDLESGRLSGAEGSLMIGQDVLDKVKFIQEGRFADGGEPTLNVIGNVEVVSTVPIAVEQLVPVDPAVSHPYLQRDVIRLLAERIGNGVANAHDLLCARKTHDVEQHPEWFYRNVVGNQSPQYSPSYIDWLVTQFQANPAFFREARERYKEMLG
ncbi:MAG: putative DNA binding domain-containing protein [Fimbriimonadaceae bacterium]|nr:putative DNA binding domain-containing protein [Fimbriimonadaceae bacterium]QOJ11232.1 MAG: putative DNA binding domain-containing protein [Chthonomonadaceae bacterium]